MSKPVYWCGEVTNCDTCSSRLLTIMFDGKTTHGPWANMCPSCFRLGPGVGRTGQGLGQKYEKQADGRWLKTEG